MRKVLWSLLFFSCLINSAHAKGNWFIGGNTGASFPIISQNNHLATGAGWPDDQYNNNGVDTAAVLSAEAGYRWARQNVWLPFYSLGVSYSYVFPSTIKGTIDQYSLPQFENYKYSYKVQRQTFLAFFKADLYRWKTLMPYLLAAAGVSVNKADSFKEHAFYGVTPRISPNFGDQSNAYFSYAFGAGFDLILRENLWLNLGYEYGNQGYARTGSGQNYTTLTDTNYSTDNLQTKMASNSVLLSLIYFFDARKGDV